jgi:hypothetical protein
MKLHTAYYRSTFESRNPKMLRLSWADLSADLGRFRPHHGSKDERLRVAPLWSPVKLKEPRRLSSAVVEVSCLVLDYDDAAALTVPQALARWEGFERLGYTTWSHSEAAPRCRVVLPLQRPVPGHWWADLYRALLEDQGQGADPQCIDPSRAYYLPAVGAGGPHTSERRDGDWLDLYGRAQELADRKARREAMRAQERQQRARDARRALQTSDNVEEGLRRALSSDTDARRSLAEVCGAELFEGTGSTIARRMTCPACGRPAVWWAVRRGWAYCNHRVSCGWSGHLLDYARLVGAA